LKEGSTQVFIETPYRNDSIIKDVLSTCGNETFFSIAADITLPSEYIRTMPVGEWKKEKISLNDHPAVFLIGNDIKR